jgi:hypothetical protein
MVLGMKRLPLRLAALLAVPAALAAAPSGAPGNARDVLDAYLAWAAAAVPAYRADPRPGGDPARGRRLASSPALGWFTYRPRTYAELAPAERLALWRDPRLRSFLAAARSRAARIPLPARELLRPGPLVLVLADP